MVCRVQHVASVHLEVLESVEALVKVEWVFSEVLATVCLCRDFLDLSLYYSFGT